MQAKLLLFECPEAIHHWTLATRVESNEGIPTANKNQGYDSNFFVFNSSDSSEISVFQDISRSLNFRSWPTNQPSHTGSTSTGPTPDSLLEAAWRKSKVGAVRNGVRFHCNLPAYC